VADYAVTFALLGGHGVPEDFRLSANDFEPVARQAPITPGDENSRRAGRVTNLDRA
jgi:hypothetical protein